MVAAAPRPSRELAACCSADVVSGAGGLRCVSCALVAIETGVGRPVVGPEHSLGCANLRYTINAGRD